MYTRKCKSFIWTPEEKNLYFFVENVGFSCKNWHKIFLNFLFLILCWKLNQQKTNITLIKIHAIAIPRDTSKHAGGRGGGLRLTSDLQSIQILISVLQCSYHIGHGKILNTRFKKCGWTVPWPGLSSLNSVPVATLLFFILCEIEFIRYELTKFSQSFTT